MGVGADELNVERVPEGVLGREERLELAVTIRIAERRVLRAVGIAALVGGDRLAVGVEGTSRDEVTDTRRDEPAKVAVVLAVPLSTGC